MTPRKKKPVGLQHMLKNEGSPLSMNDGRDYSVAGRSAADLSSDNPLRIFHSKYPSSR